MLKLLNLTVQGFNCIREELILVVVWVYSLANDIFVIASIVIVRIFTKAHANVFIASRTPLSLV